MNYSLSKFKSVIEQLMRVYSYRSNQNRYKIADVEIGGDPGKRPVVLIGSIFYRGDKRLHSGSGDFNRKLAEAALSLQDEMSDKTGNPCMVDVVLSNNQNIPKYLNFVEQKTDSPILLDAPTPEIRIEGLKYIAEVGFKERIIYNSIMPSYTNEEIDKIRELQIKSSIFLSWDIREHTTKGRIKIIKEKLRPLANEANISSPIFDAGVIDLPSLGQACEVIDILKDELGLVIGCGAHNAVSTWSGLKNKFGENAEKTCIASVMAAVVMSGADFILYGPVDHAPNVFPSVASIDAALSQIRIDRCENVPRNHPRYLIA